MHGCMRAGGPDKTRPAVKVTRHIREGVNKGRREGEEGGREGGVAFRGQTRIRRGGIPWPGATKASGEDNSRCPLCLMQTQKDLHGERKSCPFS